jgi:phage-related baseplate assembly protein
VIDVAVSATLKYDPNATTSAATIVAANALIAGFINPTFWPRWGNPENTLYRSDLISRLQNLNGVLSVTLNAPAADVVLGQPNAAVKLLGAPTIATVAGVVI